MEPLVTIAIPDLAGPAARTATLNSLARHTPEPHEVILLIEEARRQNVSSWSDNRVLRQISVPGPFGTPAALNRLLTICTTPYLLLLESGAIVTSGWLGRLLAAFNDPAVGLSGPSTNTSWNEQQIAPANRGQGWSVQQIDTYATSVSARYRNQCHPLDTLHSLGDFCYLFKRSVAEQLGGFDEAYGAGPCWEIDFNTRAARAGFQAVWVADAYVHRAPATPRQAQTVRHLFTTSKHLYQDKFCGLRLRGEKTSYESHCRGEACEHFAPPDLIQVTLQQALRSQPSEEPCANKKNNDNAPGSLSAVATQSLEEASSLAVARSNTPPKTAEEREHATISSQIASTSINGPPLVSCIMPTRNRRAFMRQALAYFERQDYPNAEDAAFLKQACLRGARLHKLPHDNSFVYLRHDGNAWRFPLGSYLQPTGWQHADLRAFLPPADLSFYATLSPAAPALTSSSPCIARKNEPLVSCIMPTYNRRAFVVQAIAYFLRQEYANKELIIVDDGTDAICDLVPADERIRYIHLREKTTIGAKRNLACEQARGTIIAHWDDDDWQALHRLRYQVEALLLTGTNLCGISAPLFYEMESGRAWQYVYPTGQKGWLSGSTLCYKRTFWASNRFADINVGEDARFVWGSRREHMTVLGDATFHVGMIHKQNVSPKKTNGPYWHLYPVEEIRHLLGADWTFYQLPQMKATTDLQSANIAHV